MKTLLIIVKGEVIINKFLLVACCACEGGQGRQCHAGYILSAEGLVTDEEGLNFDQLHPGDAKLLKIIKLAVNHHLAISKGHHTQRPH